MPVRGAVLACLRRCLSMSVPCRWFVSLTIEWPASFMLGAPRSVFCTRRASQKKDFALLDEDASFVYSSSNSPTPRLLFEGKQRMFAAQ